MQGKKRGGLGIPKVERGCPLPPDFQKKN